MKDKYNKNHYKYKTMHCFIFAVILVILAQWTAGDKGNATTVEMHSQMRKSPLQFLDSVCSL